MNKITFFVSFLCLFCTFWACGNKANEKQKKSETTIIADTDVETREYKVSENGFEHTYIIANHNDSSVIYKNNANKENCFIVISKKEYRLYVYETTDKDTILVSSFPVTYAINPEAKESDGDKRTPECGMDNPFSISEIVDASNWFFDFGDGRGSILAFGNWFLRLDLSKSFPDNEELAKNRTIGIHGSTGNECSVPGRDSHGCIRLRDTDLITLHDKYVQIGTPVIIKGIHENKLSFEINAQKKLGDKYHSPKKENPLLNQKNIKNLKKVEPATKGSVSAAY